MYLLLIVRFLLGLVPGTQAVSRRFRMASEMVFHRRSAIGAAARCEIPHEWMSMADILAESSAARGCHGRGTFTRANHPIRSVFRLARQWAWGGELCPVFAATESVRSPQSRHT